MKKLKAKKTIASVLMDAYWHKLNKFMFSFIKVNFYSSLINYLISPSSKVYFLFSMAMKFKLSSASLAFLFLSKYLGVSLTNIKVKINRIMYGTK